MTGFNRSAGLSNRGLWISCVFVLLCMPHLQRNALAQQIGDGANAEEDVNVREDRERTTADRYLQVLLRRPRPGVALDRVYGFHLQNESMDQLRDQLLSDPDAADAGRRRMLWGLVQLQRGRPADAAKTLAAAESELPDDAGCSYYLGRASLAVGDTENAVQALERAIERRPARAEALPIYTELGRIYSRAGMKDKARSVWSRLESVFPGDSRVGSEIAKTLAAEGQFGEARDRYRQLAETTRKPDEKVVFSVSAAEMLRRDGRSDDATAELEEILARLRPGSWLHTDVRNRIESGFLNAGNYDALADYYRKQLAANEDDLTVSTRLARVLILAGRMNEAQEVLEDSVRRAPDDLVCRMALVDVLVARRDATAAANQLGELCRRDPRNPDLLIRWGQVLLDDLETPLDERREAAFKIWMRLASERSDDAVTLSQVADLMRGIERRDDAIALYEAAIKADGRSPQYREYLGEYLHSIDRQEEAIEIWNSIAQGERRGRDSLVRLAEILATFERPDLSLKAWREASEFDLLFSQELRFAGQLVEAKRLDEALARLDVAASLAETPEERDQLLQKRIGAYQASGTLEEQIRKVAALEPSAGNLRTLALMHSAVGDLVEAERAISKAVELAPEDTTVLLVAADLAERENRLGDAAAFFDDLSVSDQRYRTNHLQRVAGLRVRLGQFDQAMEVCQAIIDANPASSESYQFLARTAFEIGRDEEGVAALRRAMSVAPRDNSPRRMLASHYAERYRTDEAIELYWQTYRQETKPEDQRSVIRSLAPLYDRKNEMETLISRIEEIHRKEGDGRRVPLAKAAAYESVQDYGAAAGVVEELLVSQPGAVSLLETMVRLSDVADDIEKATEYQRRICDLASTAENRFKLMRFQMESGAIDASEAVAKRLSLVSDSEQLGRIIRSTLDRGDLSSARLICEQALKNDPDLWDVRAILMQLLLVDSGKSPEKILQDQNRALALAAELKKLDLPGDASPPTAKKANAVGGVGSTISAKISPLYWGQSVNTLGRAMKVGRYAKNTYGSSSTVRPNPVLCYGQAKVMADAVTMLIRAVGQSPEEGERRVWEQYEAEFGDDDIEKVSEPIRLWEMQSALNVVNTVLTKPASSNWYTTYLAGRGKPPETRNERLLYDQMRIWWRLAEIDRENGAVVLLSLLGQRNFNNAHNSHPDKKFEPLTEQRLATLMRVNRQVQKHGLQNARVFGIVSGSPKLQFLSTVAREVQLAEKPELAEQLLPDDLGPESSYDEIMGAILVSLRLGKTEHAEDMLDLLIPAARREKPRTTAAVVSRSAYQTGGYPENVSEFKRAHQKVMADAEIIRWIHRRKIPTAKRQTLGNGAATAYVPTATSATSYSVSVPLSTRLMDAELASGVAAFTQPLSKNPGQSRQRKVRLDESLISHLNQKLEGASEDELKTRRIVAAYAHWWADQPEACFESLSNLCRDYPGDIELQIEQARLAAVLQKPELALELLDAFHPLDSQMLVRKEMAAMNLAAEMGNTERAKAAATRLFGMRLDTKTQLMLVDQLRQLGLERESIAMLQRTRSGRSADLGTQLQVAQAFLSSGDKEAASEVAYGVFRRTMSARRVRGSSSTLKRKAVSILKSTDRLDPLVEQYERRVEASPRARRPRQQLAEIYDAVGRREDAAKMRVELASILPEGVPRMLAQADAFVNAQKYPEAVGLYLDAFDKEPRRIASDYRKLTSAATRAGEETIDQVFKRLNKFPVENIPPNRMDDLIRMGSSSTLSEAKKQFVGTLLRAPHAGPDLYNMVVTFPKEQREAIPGYREAMLGYVCSPAAFTVNASVWRVRSRGKGGEAVGALADTIGQLRQDPKAAERFRQAAEQAQADPAKQPTSKFLIALLEMDQEGHLEESMRVMGEAIELAQGEGKPKLSVSQAILWQAGQMLEEDPRVPRDFVIRLYVEAVRLGQSGGSPDSTLESRMIRLYAEAGQVEEARKLLWRMWTTGAIFSGFRSTRGYADLQKFQMLQWVVGKLKSLELHADVMVASAYALRDKQSFTRVMASSQQYDFQRFFESEFASARQSITSAMAADYLNFRVALWEQDLKKFPLDLMETPPTALLDAEMPSSLAFNLKKAVEDDDGVVQVRLFAERVAKLSDDLKTWQWAGLELMTACYLHATNVGELEKTLLKRLAEVDSATEKANEKLPANATTALRSTVIVPEAVFVPGMNTSGVLDLFPVAVAMSESTAGDVRNSTLRITEYLRETVVRLNDSSTAIALVRIGSDPGTAIEEMLDGIEAKTEETTPQQSATLCLKIASDAAKMGEIEIMVRAVRMGLGAGPPLRTSTGTGDAFMKGRATTASSNLLTTQLVGYAGQMQKIGEELELRLGFSLQLEESASGNSGTLSVASSPDHSLDESDSEGHASSTNAELEHLADAYEQILLPPQSPRPIYLYCKPIVTRGSWSFKSVDSPVVSSVSMAWAQLAVRSARAGGTPVDQRWDRLWAGVENSKDKRELSVALLNLAVIAGDLSRVDQALVMLERAVDVELPDLPERGAAEAVKHSSVVRVPLNSQSKADLASLVLHGVWPLVITDTMNSMAESKSKLKVSVARRAASLLERTLMLTQSDSTISRRISKFQKRLTMEHLRLSEMAEDLDTINRYVSDAMGAIRNTAYDVESDSEAEKRSAFKQLATRLMDEGMTGYSGPVFFELAKSKPAGERNYTTRFEPRICLELSRLDIRRRIQVLRELTFGPEDGGEGIQFIEGLVRYELPPPRVRSQLPRLQDVLNLSTSTDDYPIVNTLLMLVEASVQAGESEALRASIESRRASDPDRSELALALLTLEETKDKLRPGDDVLADLRSVLNAVEGRMRANRPKQNDTQIEFPALETHLALRAFRSGMPKGIVEPLIRSSKIYAIREERNDLVAAIAFATARMGSGRAAGALAKTPLPDFEVVSLPARGKADNERLRPLYAINGPWISGTSGYEQSHLMFAYPLVGDFKFSARVRDGSWGEADLAYGGIIFQANGWQQSAKLLGMGNRGEVTFPVPGIQEGKENVESVAVSPKGVRGVCNGIDYVTDRVTRSFPFISIHHHRYRTTQFRDLRLTGNPVIPREVNLIDASMRGWGILTRGRTIPWMLMPIGPQQNRDVILKFREKMTKDLAEGPVVGSWSVREGELHFRSRPPLDRSSDPASQIQYLRPLQDGETVEWEFFWEAGKTELAPSIGRTVLRFGPQGVSAEWIDCEDDLASVGQIPAKRGLSMLSAAGDEHVPNNRAWNTLQMSRHGDRLSVSLNKTEPVVIPVRGHERLGVYRDERKDVHVRKIRLAGNWPATVPQRWLSDADDGSPGSPEPDSRQGAGSGAKP